MILLPMAQSWISHFTQTETQDSTDPSLPEPQTQMARHISILEPLIEH